MTSWVDKLNQKSKELLKVNESGNTKKQYIKVKWNNIYWKNSYSKRGIILGRTKKIDEFTFEEDIPFVTFKNLRIPNGDPNRYYFTNYVLDEEVEEVLNNPKIRSLMKKQWELDGSMWKVRLKIEPTLYVPFYDLDSKEITIIKMTDKMLNYFIPEFTDLVNNSTKQGIKPVLNFDIDLNNQEYLLSDIYVVEIDKPEQSNDITVKPVNKVKVKDVLISMIKSYNNRGFSKDDLREFIQGGIYRLLKFTTSNNYNKIGIDDIVSDLSLWERMIEKELRKNGIKDELNEMGNVFNDNSSSDITIEEPTDSLSEDTLFDDSDDLFENDDLFESDDSLFGTDDEDDDEDDLFK